MEPIYKMLALLVLTLLMKMVEHANRIQPGGKVTGQDGTSTTYLERNLAAFYGVLNLHLSLSIGSLGIVWGSLAEEQAKGSIFFVSVALVACALLGAISRGLFSKGSPTAIKLSDWDWLFGVVIANSFGFAALVLGAGFQLTR